MIQQTTQSHIDKNIFEPNTLLGLEQSIFKDTTCTIAEMERLLVISYQTQWYHVSTLTDTILYTIQQQDKTLLDAFNSNAVSMVVSNYSEGDPTLRGVEQILKEYHITCNIINA